MFSMSLPPYCTCLILLDSYSLCSSRVAFYGVYDGHAGPKASKFTAEHLHIDIRDRLPKGQSMVTVLGDFL